MCLPCAQGQRSLHNEETMTLTRRAVFAAAALPCLPVMAGEDRLAELERQCGGRLGVAVLDTQNGRRWEHRAAERFALCSTFKFLLAAAVLARIEAGTEQSGRRIAYGKNDLVIFSPETEKHIGGMAVSALLDACLLFSDNTAANLLLKSLGGPAGWTAFARSIGDKTSRLDRWEPELNVVADGDQRDTTTPAAMLEDLQAVFLGKVLSQASLLQLETRMSASTTGAKRLQAGLPAAWRLAGKTGSGPRSRNDIAMLRPPGRAPILACVYCMDAKLPDAGTDAIIAEIGRFIAASI
jgi:beta-lactamase class A